MQAKENAARLGTPNQNSLGDRESSDF